MKKHLFSYLLICFGTGIFLSEKFNPNANLRIYFILILFCLFFSYLMKNKLLQSASICTQFLVLGLLINMAKNGEKTEENTIINTSKIQHLVLNYPFKSTTKYQKYSVTNLDNGTIGLLHIPKDSATYYPKDTLVVYANSFPLSSTKNPFQFDYSDYLRKQNITHSLYSKSVLIHKSNHNHWKKLIVKSKDFIRLKMKEQGYSTEARAIASSMLLGDRTEISQELNNNYVATGVVHILSISGLHVVMIYVILNYILQPIVRLKNGRNLRIILALIVIWIFSFYVDLQPPVFRSALMISIYYISELLKRPKNIYHTIALSALIILIFEPQYLFDVGFQLSFSAVFFIVWLNPIYKKIYQSKHKIISYFYDLSSTSISAQLGTMPFATYYFNQFSWLFLFGNLVLIPASFFMIIGAIIAIILVCLDLRIGLYIKAFNLFITGCNQYIKWLSSFDDLIVSKLYISPLIAIILIIIIYCIRPLILNKSKVALTVILVGLLCIQINLFIDVRDLQNTNEIVVFNVFKESLIGIRNGQNLTLFTSENLDSSLTKQYIIHPFETRNRIIKTRIYNLDEALDTTILYKSKSVLQIANLRLFIGENLTIIPEKIDYILVRNSSFKPNNVETLNQIKRVITDASNYPSYIDELDDLMENQSDSILWKTSEKGYFKIKF